MTTLPFRGAIFDLDGVITSTERLHFQAWKKLFEGDVQVAKFSKEDYLQYVDGKPRISGIRDFLRAKKISISEAQIARLADVKQNHFLKLVETKGVKLLSGALQLIRKLKQKGVKVGVVSSSKNTPLILRKAKIDSIFNVIIAADEVISQKKKTKRTIKGKPAPDIFLAACDVLGLRPSEVVGFEDALSGIQALKSAGIMSVAIMKDKNKLLMNSGADLVVNGLNNITLSLLSEKFFNLRKRSKLS